MNETKNHADNAFVFIETITPVEGHLDDVLAISLRSAKLLEGRNGLIQSMVAKSEKKGSEITAISVWSSKSDFQNFMKSEDVAILLKSDDMKNIKSYMSNYDMLMSDLVESWHG